MMYKILRLGEKYLKPILKSHPKLFNFVLAIREAIKELARPDPQSKSFLDSKLTIPGESDVVPSWLIKEWAELNKLEPLLFPNDYALNWMIIYDIPHSKVGEHYLPLYQQFGHNVSHVFLVPQLTSQYTDTALAYAQTIQHEQLSHEIVVVATEKCQSSPPKNLPEGVRFVEYDQFSDQMNCEEAELLLVRVLVQMAPQVIQIFGSELGNSIFVKYGPALASVSNLYAFLSLPDSLADKYIVQDYIRQLPDYYDYLSGIIGNSPATVDWCCQIYGFDRNKLFVYDQTFNEYDQTKFLQQLKQLPNYTVSQ